jgi:hypothetical protein
VAALARLHRAPAASQIPAAREQAVGRARARRRHRNCVRRKRPPARTSRGSRQSPSLPFSSRSRLGGFCGGFGRFPDGGPGG